MPVKIERVEDVGRHKIVRAFHGETPINGLLDESESLPAEAKFAVFDQAEIGIFLDSWRVAPLTIKDGMAQ